MRHRAKDPGAMAITKIKVSNFKSFDELELDLRPLNVVVGGNASGKSNFLEIFRFLRDYAAHGLENAVSLQGGMEYLTNFRIRASRPLSLEVSLKIGATKSLIQKISLQASEGSSGFEVIDDWCAIDEQPMDARLDWSAEIALFDFDPKLPKKGVPLTGKADLESDGSNLALVLKNLLQDQNRRKSLLLLLQDLLPFIEDLRVESFLDRSLLLSLRESYGTRTYVPASFLSDGTLQMVALILALYFEKAAVTILEEPDRNIHPHLISRLVDMMQDSSARKQVIATTHNPELVKHAPLESLLLVHRDQGGFSRISRPSESEELKVFLANDLGVEDLYVQNLLDIGHGV